MDNRSNTRQRKVDGKTAAAILLALVMLAAGGCPDSLSPYLSTGNTPSSAAQDAAAPGSVTLNVSNLTASPATVHVDFYIGDVVVHHAEGRLSEFGGGNRADAVMSVGPDRADRVEVSATVGNKSTGREIWNDQQTYVVGEQFKDGDTLAYAITVQPLAEGRATTPVAVGQDISVNEGTLVSLDGSASNDPTGDALSYRWQQASGQTVSLQNADEAVATFTAPAVEQDQSLVFHLTVTNGSGQSSMVVVRVFVHGAPVAVAKVVSPPEAGKEVTLDGTASLDPAGGTLLYKWEQVSGQAVSIVGTDQPQATFVAPDTVSGEPLVFKLTVTNGSGLSSSAQVSVRVELPPVAIATAPSPVSPGILVRLDGSRSSAPAGGSLSYKWQQVSGIEVTLSDADKVVATFTAPAVSTTSSLVFQLTVTTIGGLTASCQAVVTVAIVSPPPGPSATAVPAVATSGQRVALIGPSGSTGSKGAIGAPSATYEWTQLSGPAVSIQNAKLPTASFVAPPAVNKQNLMFQLTVSSSSGSSTTSVTVPVWPSAG